MHPVIMRQLAADHIAELHAKAENERLTRPARPARPARRARRAGRRAPSLRLRPSLRGTLSYDDPRLDADQRPATHEQPTAPHEQPTAPHEQPTAPPVPVMAARTPGSAS